MPVIFSNPHLAAWKDMAMIVSSSEKTKEFKTNSKQISFEKKRVKSSTVLNKWFDDLKNK